MKSEWSKYNNFNLIMLKKWYRESGMNDPRCADDLGVSVGFLQRMMRGTQEISFHTLLKMQGIGIQIRHEKMDECTFFLLKWGYSKSMTKGQLARELKVGEDTLNRWMHKQGRRPTKMEQISLVTGLTERYIEEQFAAWYRSE